ncbi:MAG: stage 0 sporulation protein [Deltaproteobacteria bacterium SG8_13]|nr:MAG: stage 0 sporulation protein [Deltaproteobacteria bacterium SG8_13]
MKKIVGIRFKPAGKVYDFDCGAFVLNQGDAVIVQTEQGLSYGTVAIPPVIIDEEKTDKKLKKVYRLASAQDREKLDRIAEDQKRAHWFCVECINNLDLQMNLFEVEKSFDESKYTFFFTAEGRVDFRQLVKMLVKEFGVRIEMRQVGIRNQAKMCGGIGRCGREICCSSFLEKFGPVSIRMAKEQNLSLNPTKISGQCGRLMCCLTYEYDVYRKLKGEYPKVNSWVATPSGRGKIIRHNVMTRQVTVRLEDGNEVELQLQDIKPSPN